MLSFQVNENYLLCLNFIFEKQRTMYRIFMHPLSVNFHQIIFNFFKVLRKHKKYIYTHMKTRCINKLKENLQHSIFVKILLLPSLQRGEEEKRREGEFYSKNGANQNLQWYKGWTALELVYAPLSKPNSIFFFSSSWRTMLKYPFPEWEYWATKTKKKPL